MENAPCRFTKSQEGFLLENAQVRLTYTNETALYGLEFLEANKPATGKIGFEFRYQGKMYTELNLLPFPCTCEEKALPDGGMLVTVTRPFGFLTISQEFQLHPGESWALVRLLLTGQDIVSSNYLCPLYAQGSVFALPQAKRPRLLYVPYDNDKWIRYRAQELQTCGTSYEVTSVYDDDTRCGYVIGSVTHDQWKTGITTHGGYGELSAMRVFGGAADTNTRDPYHPHGAVRGKTISSPWVMAGYFADFRQGLCAYGQVNARFMPAPKWENGVIFGWNSWACLTTHISYDAFKSVSDTFQELKEYKSNGDVYINFDAFWDRLTPEELQATVDLAHSRGQKAGIYYTPFTCWTHNFDQVVEGTNGQYTYRDLILRDENDDPIPPIAGGYPIDPTHPGNLMRVQAMMEKTIKMGFDYLKVDFMSHGACEGVHYLRDITTGVEAYNYGLKAMCQPILPENLGRPFFLDFSIAPLFPHGYANARRISCDSFGQIYDAEYMLNSLTYSFWQNGTIYNYTDPDHTCLYHSVGRPISTQEEAQSRLLASVIGGTVLLLSDDYRNEEAAARTRTLLTKEYLQVAREGRPFLPVECDRDDKASRFFYRQDCQRVYLAVFNFDEEEAVLTLPVSRIPGVSENAVFQCQEQTCTGPMLHVKLKPRGCALLHWDKE